MGNEASAVPLAQLQYQSDFNLRSNNLARLVAKWCIVIGAFGVVRLGFLVASFYRRWPGGFALRSMTELAGLLIEMVSSLGSILLILFAIGVLLGQTRRARWFWILLLVLLAIQLSQQATWLVSLGSFNSAFRASPANAAHVLVNMAYNIVPCALLLSVARLPDVKDAIGGAD